MFLIQSGDGNTNNKCDGILSNHRAFGTQRYVKDVQLCKYKVQIVLQRTLTTKGRVKKKVIFITFGAGQGGGSARVNYHFLFFFCS